MPASTKPPFKKAKALSKSTNPATSAPTSLKTGAPAQHTQGSRKGKRAWRKNVDIGEVEEGLEGLRAEERVVGKPIQKHKNEELFQIDVKGDEKIRKQLPRFSASQLSSTKILAARSAVPAVFSRPYLPSTKRKAGPYISPEEKARLLRIGKRLRKGPLNSVMDPTEFGAGSALLEVSEAARMSGGYDPWGGDSAQVEEAEMPDGMETVHKPKIKRPVFAHPRDIIEIPAIAEPHQGTSYNPPVDAHTELIVKANEMEERRAKEVERLVEIKDKIARAITGTDVTQEGVPAGMVVDERGEEDEEGAEGEDGDKPLAKKAPERKTKQQKQKAARQRAEKRALAEKSFKKRMLSNISSVKALRKEGSAVLRRQTELETQREQRQLALVYKMRKGGMQGMRVGRHKVPEQEVDVQLGEDLSESLRALKPEGNLFRDRFQSLQQRALVEPRVPVLPSKRTFKIKEYEKHAWKNFDRE